MKTVTDKNISGTSADNRRQAFDISSELMAMANVDILFTSQLYNRFKDRLKDDHKTFFESMYRIDKSTEDVPDFDVHKSIKTVIKAESKVRGVVVITSNKETHEVKDCNNTIYLEPPEYIKLVNKARSLKKRGLISSLDDSLWFVFFLDDN